MTYTVGASEEGKSIKAVISYQDGQGFDETVTTSAASIPYVDNGQASFSINGTAAVGNTLSIKEDSADPDGNGTLSYSWQTSSDNSSWSVVGTNATYTVGASEEGKSIKAVISYQDGQGFDETVTTSAASIPYVDNGQASFSINGTAAVGNTLSIKEDSSDPDGNGTLSYSWQTSSDNSSWSVVGTNATYTVGASEEGKSIKAVISYQDGQGFDETVTTSAASIPYVDNGRNGTTSDLIDVIKSYISILDNNQHSLELNEGNIDISYNSNNYIFKLEEFKFTGKVPATENTSEINSDFIINGSLKLSGKDISSNNIYTKLTADFDISTLYKSENSASTSNTSFGSEDLYLDLIGEFKITDDNLGRPKIISNLDDIQLIINKDNNGDDPKIDFRVKTSHPSRESLRINDKLVYEFFDNRPNATSNLNISGDFFNFYDFTINKTLSVLNGDIFNLIDKNDFSFNASSALKNNDIKFSFSENNEFYLENILEGEAFNRGIENIDINLIPNSRK